MSVASQLTSLFTVEDAHPRATCCWCKAPLVSILGKRFWRCPTAACFKRQMAQAVMTNVRGKIQHQYIPLPIQTLFIETVLSQKFRRILFGGAAGVSKSHALRWLGHALCLKYPGFKVLLLRRTYKQLENSHIQPAMQEAEALGGKYSGAALGHSNSVQYANGSSLKFGHCEKKGDEVNYLSDEYDLILFDEETTFEESQIVLIGSRARTSRSDGWVPLVCGGTNPGGVSAVYCLSHFINKNPDPQKYPYYNPNDYLYIAGTLDDNPYLNVSYEQSLDDLPRELREAYRFGNWAIFPGQFWKEYKPKVHTALIDVPTSVERFCSLDWGYTNPGVCLWWCCLADGKFYIEDEYVFTETIASEVAKEIKKRSNKRGITVRYTAADPSMWAKEGQLGESIAETMRKAGLFGLRQAKNDRILGWQRLRHLLRLDHDDVPFLRINPTTCPYLCRTFPQSVSEKSRPEDMDSSGDDHALDACFLGNTLITTRKGERQLITVGMNDEVWTRQGWKKVDAIFRVGSRPTMIVTFTNGRELRGTPDHPIWVDGEGFIPLTSVRSGDIMRSCQNHLDFPGRIAMHAVSGADTMDQFRRGIISTIGIGTRKIMYLLIWSASQGRSIFECMARNIRQALNIWHEFVLLPWLGIVPVQDGIGISNTEYKYGRREFPSLKSALFVMSPTPIFRVVRPLASVLESVNRSGDVTNDWTTKYGSAGLVEKILRPITMTRPAHVLLNVLGLGSTLAKRFLQRATIATFNLLHGIGEPSGVPLAVASVRLASPADVYNITVADVHEYYANGILVANCRYGAMSRPTPTLVSAGPRRAPKEAVRGCVGELAYQILEGITE